MLIRVYFTWLCIVVSGKQCANILGIFPNVGYSQFIAGNILMTELAKRGHNVTMVSAYEPDQVVANYRTVLINQPPRASGSYFVFYYMSLFKMASVAKDFYLGSAEHLLSEQRFQDLLKSNSTFDVAIVEIFGSDAHLAVAKHFKCPLIAYSAIGFSERNSHLVGEIRLPSITAWSFSSYTTHMGFWERFHNTAISFYDIVYRYLFFFPRQQQLVDKYFPGKINLDDVIDSVDMVLMNSHHAVVEPAILSPAVIEIGGFHIRVKELPKEIKSFLDGAKHGAILFSLGTNLRSEDIPQDKLGNIIRAIGNLKQRVLWKFEDVDIPDKPPNLMVSKWLPQTSILAHPNIVAFISHGGLQSCIESVHFGVPVIGLPVFSDQKRNIRSGVSRGTTIHLYLEDFDGDTLYNAVKEITENPSYAKNAKRYADILKDRLTEPTELAMYWIEYIIRHKGGKHLISAAKDLYWFQLYLLDIFVLIFVCFIALCLIVKLIVLRFGAKKTIKRKTD